MSVLDYEISLQEICPRHSSPRNPDRIKDVEVGFLQQIGQYGYGIVGQKGFFDIFVVKFDLVKEEIELKPR